MKIIDLDLFVNEPIAFKIGNDTYEVPSSPSTQLVLQMVAIENKAKKAKNAEEQIQLLAEMVATLLSQGERNVTKDEVMKKFSPAQMTKVVEVYQKTVMEINSNPNS
ncbi:hypothetical protein [Anoxybacillus flavithermus]|jgi:hypothetical protein|uniref:hypothetical protein n=1 Tax=Anoxybacillus flavithermus TaxID=33934 RepID=UPI0018692D15|nr:hypothetical protein [Anoxybacillus flavithermus]MBE2926597.1 hypothetical protein [Anoxybacillus flavithermus]MBE2937468.1 hypothetical protein [Anoxybacillus flavithermus]MBE2945110.1 hypothetical protein [Anoxybacillus flavithermus]MBE2948102.1 hypothetical protein [Anoxybacillus flavithermus]